jgi:hypothetical protein
VRNREGVREERVEREKMEERNDEQCERESR